MHIQILFPLLLIGHLGNFHTLSKALLSTPFNTFRCDSKVVLYGKMSDEERRMQLGDGTVKAGRPQERLTTLLAAF